MSHYDDIRNRIQRNMIPLPILFRDDYSVDHAGIAKYVAWHMEQGSGNFCLTFTYSILDFITNDEIVAVTQSVMDVVKDDAVFISCTGGGPLGTTIETVQRIEATGAQATFVHLPEHCLQNSFMCGELYVKYILDVARESKIPLLAVALGVPGVSPIQTMLSVPRLEELCAAEQFIGLKDDIYVLENRREISRHFAGRMGVTGGGIFDHYIFFHHLPNQGEFHGIFNPKRGSRQLELLDEGNYLEVFRMMEEEAQFGLDMADPHWIAGNHAMFYGMGFAESYAVRPPIETATADQAKQIIHFMRDTPLIFERVSPDR